MAPDRLRSLVVLCMAPLVIAMSLPSSSWADPAAWNGEYTITFIVGPRSGSSIAAGQPEGQYTDWDCICRRTSNGNPARADVRYTPQPDGSLSGTMHTEILSGACQGTLTFT